MFFELKQYTPGLGLRNKITLLKRLELTNSTNVNTTPLVLFKDIYKKKPNFFIE